MAEFNKHSSNDTESVAVVRQIMTAAGGSIITDGRHLQYGDAVRFTVLPKRDGVPINEAGMVRELALRFVPGAVPYDWWWDKPGGADWIAANDVSHPNGGDLIYSDTPDFVAGNGNARWDVDNNFTEFLDGQSNGFSASVRLTFDDGDVDERTLNIVEQFEILAPANPHDGNEFDPTELFK